MFFPFKAPELEKSPAVHILQPYLQRNNRESNKKEKKLKIPYIGHYNIYSLSLSVAGLYRIPKYNRILLVDKASPGPGCIAY